ncbi:MAG: competence/damage-inducible protein A [Lachnospiraceae bacterium]|nr:competence/damage-inducible protein A [Lachnospiraceae bacterium]
MRVELITVGTEILMGNIVNTNAAYLSEQCVGIGLSVLYETTVGDNEERMLDAIRRAISRVDIVILTGGLGPTPDDLTKEMVAKALGKELIEDAHSKEMIASYFQKRQKVTPNNWKQALIIEGCMVLDNHNGTAPGLIAEAENGVKCILLPGPPDELKPLFAEQVRPYLESLQEDHFYSKMVKICGVGESAVADRIGDLIEAQTNPTIATYAKIGQVHVRVTAMAKTPEEGERLLAPMMGELRKRFGDDIFTEEESVTLEETVVSMLREHGLTVSFAESCTGGMASARIVNVPGASDVLNASFVTYANEAKHKLIGVKKETLEKYGAVSPQTASEMAFGVAKAAHADIGVGITGIAGPDGGTPEKPVGLVYIGVAYGDDVAVIENHFSGNREKVRERSVNVALDLVRRALLVKKNS